MGANPYKIYFITCITGKTRILLVPKAFDRTIDHRYMIPHLPAATNSLIQEAVSRILKISEDQVSWVILYGSFSAGNQREDSDIDLCVYLEAGKDDRFRIRRKILGSLEEKFDVQIFQDIPIYIRLEVLKGQVLFCRDVSQLNDIAYSTILDYNLFEHSYKLYLGMSDY